MPVGPGEVLDQDEGRAVDSGSGGTPAPGAEMAHGEAAADAPVVVGLDSGAGGPMSGAAGDPGAGVRMGAAAEVVLDAA